MSRGIDYITRKICNSIKMLEVSLPQPWNNFQTANKPESSDEKIEAFLAYADPTRQIYIGLIPMLVAIFEFYFKETFRVLASYGNDILSEITQNSSNIKLGTPEIIDSFIEKINFQDLKNVRKKYKRYADLDIKSIIEKSNSTKDTYKKLKQLIKLRHNIVHRLDSDQMFTRKDFLEFHKVLKESLSSITCNIIAKYKLNTEEIY